MSGGAGRVLSKRFLAGTGWLPWMLWPVLLCSTMVALSAGRLTIGPGKVFGILASNVVPMDIYWTETEARVIELARLPGILIAIFVGGGVAMTGAALQGIFRNPLADPQIIGASAGAAFGGVLALLLFPSSDLVMLSAFLFGMVALVMVYWLSHVGGRSMVLMGRATHIGAFGSPRREDYEIARRCLDRLGIRSLEDRVVTRLSGGERQLVLIARALASGCRTIILDEPASALDFRNQQVILSTLRYLSREHGMTVVFSTHYPQHATCLADKVLLMHGSGSHQFGDAGQILTEQNLSRLYGVAMRSLEFIHNGVALRTFAPCFER